MIHIDRLAKSFTAPATRATHATPAVRALGWRGLLPVGRQSLRTVQAVSNVSFDAPNGHITGLLGPNGAGKTTTLRMLAALISPDSGHMAVDGIDVRSRPREALARMGVLSDARGLYPRLSARENIVYYGQLQGLDRDAA